MSIIRTEVVMGLHDLKITGTSTGRNTGDVEWTFDFAELRVMRDEDGNDVGLVLALGQPAEPVDLDDGTAITHLRPSRRVPTPKA